MRLLPGTRPIKVSSASTMLPSPPIGAVVVGHHGFADAVRHEPSRLVGDAEHAVQLVGADALLARHEQVHCQQPLVQRNLAALEHGADGDGELLAAIVALDDALADRAFGLRLDGLATLRREPLGIDRTAVRANRTVRPTQGFQMLAGASHR